jgi:hypothetical protein
MTALGRDPAMYVEHPVFQNPENEDAKIWRYMDLPKLLSLVDKKSLFLARADKLGDPFEGSYSKWNIVLRPMVYPKEVQQVLPILSDFSKRLLRSTVVNSWHISEFESAALWKLYLKSDEGVSVQSTFRRLRDSLSGMPDTHVFIGKVEYIDYNTDWLPEGNMLYPFVHKRKSFEHERELRAVVQKYPASGAGLNSSTEVFQDGLYVPVDLQVLIERIYVSPSSTDWFFDLVKSVVSKYGPTKEVVRSSLSEGPVY